ncbi:hypothetical protein Tco_0155131 [Tanacetum coccineum]
MGKRTIKTSCIDFEKVSYVEELKFNILSVSQICDKKHNVLLTDKECLILSPKRGAIDKTLFIKKDRRDFMLVQVYVDDIIFGSTKSSTVKDFEDLMQKEFKMSYQVFYGEGF